MELAILIGIPLLRNVRRRGIRQEALIRTALREGRSVAIDNTSPTRADRAPLIALARAYGARVVGYAFEIDVSRSLEWNAARLGCARVPDVAIHVSHARFEAPRPEEGFDALYQVCPAGDGRFDVTPIVPPTVHLPGLA